MLYARDKSQMCNNLLQYAHVYAWGREHGRKVISMRFSYKYKFFKISHSDLVSFPRYLFAKYASALGLLPTASFKHSECDAEALEHKMLKHKNIVVSGWFVRYYDLFLKYRNEICDLFTIDEQYTVPVKQRIESLSPVADDTLRLGVHIRRGDYAVWKDGIYCYDDLTYAAYINAFAKLFPEKKVHVYLSTNDPLVVEAQYAALTRESANVTVHYPQGNAVEDLYMLSQCDYLIGPPSTYSLVASMYHDIPLCRMDTAKPDAMILDSFKKFDYWFRRIV